MSLTPSPALVDALNAHALVLQYVPGGVWWGMADQSAAFPYTVVSLIDGQNDNLCMGEQVGMLNALYRVLTYAPMKTATVETLTDAATAAHNALMALPQGTVLDGWEVRRVRWRALEERAIPESGEDRLQAVGGRYEVSMGESLAAES